MPKNTNTDKQVSNNISFDLARKQDVDSYSISPLLFFSLLHQIKLIVLFVFTLTFNVMIYPVHVYPETV